MQIHLTLFQHKFNLLMEQVKINTVRFLTAGINDLEMLKMEAAEKKFPDNELLRKLNTVLKDIERSQQTSTELLSNPKTGYDAKQMIQTFTLSVSYTHSCGAVLFL